MNYYIKERHSPQLKTYYVAYGKMYKKDAKKIEDGSIYGSNIMREFKTEKEYLDKCTELKINPV